MTDSLSLLASFYGGGLVFGRLVLRAWWLAAEDQSTKHQSSKHQTTNTQAATTSGCIPAFARPVWPLMLFRNHGDVPTTSLAFARRRQIMNEDTPQRKRRALPHDEFPVSQPELHAHVHG
jgi:hypothetical protein